MFDSGLLRSLRWLKWVTGGYKKLQEDRGVTMGYKGLHEVTRDYKRLQWVTKGYRGLQVVTGGYKGLQELTRDCKG